MNTHADKTQDNKSQSVANGEPQMQSSGESTFQFVDNRPEAVAQRKLQEMANNSPQAKKAAQLQAIANNYSMQHKTIQKKEKETGLPDNLKSGIENLSGYSMDDVKVHYNSGKPVQLQAHAHAQGTDIHLASGQEKHLPHEAWHVVQQKQGRVKPTRQLKGQVAINDDEGLENEADVMGDKALQLAGKSKGGMEEGIVKGESSSTIQLRSRNPFNPNTGELGVESITAHHIIPHSFLKGLLTRFGDDEKTEVKKNFLPKPEDLTLWQLSNLNELQINDDNQVVRANEVNDALTTFLEKNDVNTPLGGELVAAIDIDMDGLGDSFYEWQAGNQFHGPKDRAEPGTSDEFDFDGRFVYSKDHMDALNEIYEELKPLDESLKANLDLLEGGPNEAILGYLNKAIDDQRAEIRGILVHLSEITKEVDIPENAPSMWKEIDLRRCKDILNERIFETKRFGYFSGSPQKLPKDLISEILDEIKLVPREIGKELVIMKQSESAASILVGLRGQVIKQRFRNLSKKVNSAMSSVTKFTVANGNVCDKSTPVLKNTEQNTFSDFTSRIKSIGTAIKRDDFTDENVAALNLEIANMKRRNEEVQTKSDQLSQWISALK